MKAKPLRKLLLIHTLLAVVIIFFGVGITNADDTDVYRASVKNNAMLVIDVSGSMDWPVYDANIDYAAFFDWAIAAGHGHDDTTYNENLNTNGKNMAAVGWVKDKIYLVSAFMGYAEITGEDGVTKYAATGDPVYEGTTRSGMWVSQGIIDTGWEVTDWDNPEEYNTIETVTVSDKIYVVYPTKYDDSKADNDVDLRWEDTIAYANGNIAGQRLTNHQNILLTDERVDPRTGVAKDNGFLGYLQAPGIYFSGLFEDDGANYFTLTDDPDQAITDSSNREKIYAFVTGNYLSFIKLVEDLEGNSPCGYEGWQDICYQPSARVWTTVDIGDITNDQYYSDYSDNRNEICGEIGLTQFSGRKYLKLYFRRLDIENREVGDCEYLHTGNDSDNDGVYFVDQDGNVLRQITKDVNETPEGKIYGCNQTYVWTGEYDVTNVDKIFVRFYVGDDGGDNYSGDDLGFKISAIKWTSQESAGAPSAAGTFACCNGDDGVGYKIRSRLEVAQDAMKIVVEETKEKINWGLVKWSGYYGKVLVAGLDEGADAVIAGIDTLNANGGTPMGEAMQDAYDWMYDYLSTHTATSECSENYQVVLTDGFPSGDDDWDRIDKNSTDPVFTNSNYADADTWTGDPVQTTEANHSDDVARWMARGKCAESQDTTGTDPDYNVVTHTIGFGLESPLLNDTAEDGCGIGITAYNQTELVNAFYSLGLAMVSSVSFTAPVVSVDEANRTQSGDNLYMAFFKPKEGQHWQGNLKKYGLSYEIRADCGRGEPEWTVVDKNGTIAGDCDGSFKSSSTSYWSSSTDGGEVNSGGVGGKLKEALDAVSLGTGPYYDFRKIYTYKDGSMVRFTPSNIDNEDLDVSDDDDVYPIINYIYGYTYNADSSGYPLATRSWILGDIIHSEPRIIDYLDTDGSLQYRFIAVASNDGMVHVFTDFECTLSAETYPAGSEVFAFVPEDLLPRLQEFASADHVYMVDGACNYFRAQTQTGGYYDKTLVFGERRGGRSYWALDVTNPDPVNWTVKWHIEGGTGEFTELGYTWNKPYFAKIQTAASTYKDVAIFAGGYDTLEDGFPEEFDDDDQNPNGIRDTGETYVETANIGTYDKYNPGIDNIGRGIFAVDIIDGSILFRATYSASDDTLGIYQSYANMTFCFPADMTVIPLSTTNLVIYAADVYGQIWKITYDYFADIRDYMDADSVKWQVERIFQSNPGSDLATGDPDIAGATLTIPPDDTGRKTFYSPDVSYFGNCWTSKPVLYFGTGDRAHPRYAMISNRFYTVADHNTPTDETDLLNLTCDELDENADSDGDGDVDTDDGTRKDELEIKLRDENACRGFFRVIDKQGGCPQCSISHVGEKILSRPTLFFKNVYFTAYQPVFDDPCNPNGNAFIYALDYCWGKSVFNYSEETGPEERNIEDTYQIIQNSSIPSGVRVITRGGNAAGLISAGGAVSGVGEDLTTNIPGPPGGVSQMLWETD